MGKKGIFVKKKILVVTDMQMIGSGYKNIFVPLLTELSTDYTIMVIGFGYEREEHWWPFTILSCMDLNDLYAMVQNLVTLDITSPDIIIVGMDIPQQIAFKSNFAKYGKPYVAVTPLENPPLRMSWAAQLMTMNWVFFISELGEEAARKAGLKNVSHLQVGVDTDFWHKPTRSEKEQIRKNMGIEEDEFVVLTVAENQERKNLWGAMSAILELKRKGVKVRYVLVTRPESQFGWDIKDLGLSLGIIKDMMIVNRGIPLDNLWALYAMSDAFLLTSKAEGLGMPVLEAMPVELPIVATDTGALHELLEDGRGLLCKPEYSFIDVWGNSKRDMIDIMEAANLLESIQKKTVDVESMVRKAKDFVLKRSWKATANQVKNKIEELTNVEKKPE